MKTFEVVKAIDGLAIVDSKGQNYVIPWEIKTHKNAEKAIKKLEKMYN